MGVYCSWLVETNVCVLHDSLSAMLNHQGKIVEVLFMLSHGHMCFSQIPDHCLSNLKGDKQTESKSYILRLIKHVASPRLLLHLPILTYHRMTLHSSQVILQQTRQQKHSYGLNYQRDRLSQARLSRWRSHRPEENGAHNMPQLSPFMFHQWLPRAYQSFMLGRSIQISISPRMDTVSNQIRAKSRRPLQRLAHLDHCTHHN